jgi:hypothetical protein
VLGATQAAAVMAAVGGLERVADMGEVARLLSTFSPSATRKPEHRYAGSRQ